MKRLYFDLETTGKKPWKCDILEACFLICDSQGKPIDGLTQKVRLPFSWEQARAEEKEALRFNGISDKVQFKEHQKMAVSPQELFYELTLKLIEHFNLRQAKPQLSGWNSAYFDTVILARSMEKCGHRFSDYFNYHNRDLFHSVRFLKERNILNLERLSLSYVHKELVGTMQQEQFHKAFSDAMAVRDIDLYLNKKLEGLTP
jgi:oligoribonuclease (3'-5' exoribonuclease)